MNSDTISNANKSDESIYSRSYRIVSEIDKSYQKVIKIENQEKWIRSTGDRHHRPRPE